MPLWGTTTADSDKPKFLPVDSNAGGSSGAREHLIAVKGGWGLSPGLAASGNDNTGADPEILVCIKNLAEAMGNASVIGIDWTDATVGNVGTFDITVTFDEAVDVTSATWGANQTVTNKAYILLSRLGVTDMVEDSTVMCSYYSGSGTNQLTFRGTLTTNAAAGFLAFNGAGVGDDAESTSIVFDGTSTMDEEDGRSALGIRQEAGTASAPTVGDRIILNATAAAIATVNASGGISSSTTLTVNTVTGTLAVGQVVTVKDTSVLAISDADSNTGLSTDNSLTITAVASQTSVTLSEAVTIADDVILLASTNGGEEVNAESIDLRLVGPSFASQDVNVTLVARTGEDLDGSSVQLEASLQVQGDDRIVLDGTDGSSTNADAKIDLEDFTNGLATQLKEGTTSGSAYVLTGITVAAA
jgi:hypothetical protein